MNPRDCSSNYDSNGNRREYQLVIMDEDGMTCCVGKIYSFDEVKNAAREIRELYAKHGITHNVGYRKV